ncbi:ABC transporter ATP-binding protein [Anaerocolumna cellulosilytica]|uniref:ABC transporter ATP-binding protein n=1 Tax=Anaerocolumna cellulosilytica TaxID=433286 RepID=A0A6S6R7L6_9FIRM|nr:ABC transporter ATP-binding protein [Anaerocolumna cellulosilytica]
MMLEVVNLKKYYNGNQAVIKAVDKVDFVVEQKQFVCIIGKSGSGKSTLLNLLAGLEIPAEGEVNINGINIYKLSKDDLTKFRRRHIGFIFQNFNLLPMLNVMENIILPLSLDNKIPDEEYLKQMIELLAIEDKVDEFPSTLSGGQQQRVAIARALVIKPTILFADEPTGNLDKKTGEEVISLLQSVAKQLNQTIVMVTHDLDIANKADRVITLEDGKIIEDRIL